MKNLFRILANLLFGIRRFNNRKIAEYAKNIESKNILEIGSGKKLSDDYIYSAKIYFSKSNQFIQSDINPSFGHTVIDVSTMEFTEEYDIILCMNVLEHVFDFENAVNKLHNALKVGGELVVFVPVMYPLHDEPADYWRFTEHSLRRIFANFKQITISHSGIREFPIAYFIRLTK